MSGLDGLDGWKTDAAGGVASEPLCDAKRCSDCRGCTARCNEEHCADPCSCCDDCGQDKDGCRCAEHAAREVKEKRWGEVWADIRAGESKDERVRR